MFRSSLDFNAMPRGGVSSQPHRKERTGSGGVGGDGGQPASRGVDVAGGVLRFGQRPTNMPDVQPKARSLESRNSLTKVAHRILDPALQQGESSLRRRPSRRRQDLAYRRHRSDEGAQPAGVLDRLCDGIGRRCEVTRMSWDGGRLRRRTGQVPGRKTKPHPRGSVIDGVLRVDAT